MGVFFVDSFVLDSDFFIFLTKDIVLILEFMELALHFSLLFDGHSSLVLTVLALRSVLVVALALEVRVVLAQRFVLLE